MSAAGPSGPLVIFPTCWYGYVRYYSKMGKKRGNPDLEWKNLPSTVMPTKSDSDVILCSQLLSKTLTCKLHLSILKLIAHSCINPILWIGLIHKWSINSTDVSKMDENRCKQTLASLPFWGIQVVLIYSYYESTTEKLHMNVVVNTSSLPVSNKYRIASLLCIFETSVSTW